MGWLWSSSSPKDQQQTPSPTQPPSSDVPQPPNTSTPPPAKTLSREEQADDEFKQLWASLQSDVGQSSPGSTASNSLPSSPSDLQDQQQPPSSSIAPESLYPDSMSCRSAFDYAFFCQSFGGQFVNVYRYGELRSCSEHWENFWLCMKARGFSDEERKKAIRSHYRKKAIKYKTGPSSEDVWDLRMEPVGDSFQGDFAALEKEMQLEEEAAAAAKQ